jgi:gamma-glutamyltranspeptidase
VRSKLIVGKPEFVVEDGIVSAMHRLAAEAGVEILRQGGDAVDVVVAAALVIPLEGL